MTIVAGSVIVDVVGRLVLAAGDSLAVETLWERLYGPRGTLLVPVMRRAGIAAMVKVTDGNRQGVSTLIYFARYLQ